MGVMDRRAFIARGLAATGGGALSALALDRLAVRAALADKRGHHGSSYGEPVPMKDQRGIEVLALPAGFSYVTFGHIASKMSDGHLTPLALDGMAAFRGPKGTVRLIRNHEDRNPPGKGSVPHDRHTYDKTAGGGTTTLDYDPHSRRLVRDFVSLSGQPRQLRRRLRPAPQELADGRGDGLRAELRGQPVRGAPRLRLRGAAAPRPARQRRRGR